MHALTKTCTNTHTRARAHTHLLHPILHDECLGVDANLPVVLGRDRLLLPGLTVLDVNHLLPLLSLSLCFSDGDRRDLRACSLLSRVDEPRVHLAHHEATEHTGEPLLGERLPRALQLLLRASELSAEPFHLGKRARQLALQILGALATESARGALGVELRARTLKINLAGGVGGGGVRGGGQLQFECGVRGLGIGLGRGLDRGLSWRLGWSLG